MKRALVARLDSMGDVLLAGPAVRAIARSAQVVMLCSRQGLAAARLLPGVADVLTWDCPWILAPGFPVEGDHVAALDRAVRNGSFDEAVILTSFHQSPLPLALLLRLAGIRRITGASVDYAGALLDIRLRPGEEMPEDQPEVKRSLDIAAAAGFTPSDGDDGRLAVTPPPDVSDRVGNERYVVVHPGASAPSRTWPLEHHVELVRLLAGVGIQPVITGSRAETAMTAAVAGTDGLDLGGRTNLPELAGILAGASAVVIGNTGPAHLAAAVGTPVVSLFSPVVPAVRWQPYGVPCELLGDQFAPCRDSRATRCPVPGHPCLAGVLPQQVLAAVDRLMSDRLPVAGGAR